MKKIESLTVGMYQTNCYLLHQDNHLLIVDPGAKADRIIAKVLESGKIVDGIILTHAHLDHIGAVDECVKAFDCNYYVNEDDEPLLYDPKLNLSYGAKEIRLKNKPHFIQEGKMKIGSFDLEFVSAPGHTDGSTLMFWENHLFAGDVLFKGSIGRTDMICGSNSKMVNTLRMIQSLQNDYIVYPGHGETTTLSDEFRYNPYLQ